MNIILQLTKTESSTQHSQEHAELLTHLSPELEARGFVYHKHMLVFRKMSAQPSEQNEERTHFTS